MLVAGSAWLSRLLTAAIGLVSIRILIQELGTEQYAVYAVLGGLQGWYLLTDLGIGTSLQNHISEQRALNRHYEEYISLAGLIAILLMAASILLLYVISPFFAPALLGGVTFLNDAGKSSHFFIVGLISIATCFGGITYRIWYAEQKGYWANIVPAFASIVSLMAIVAVAKSSLHHKLYWNLVAAFGPAGALPIVLFIGRTAGNMLRIRNFNLKLLLPLMKRGLKFWLVGIMAAGVLQVDYLIMARLLNAHEIVVYNLTAKIFGLVYFIYTAVLNAVWPVCAEAITRNAWNEVNRLIVRYILLGGTIIIVSTAVFGIFGQQIISVLSPKEAVVIPISFILLFGIYQIIRSYTDTYGMVLQSMSYIRPFLVFTPFQVLINVTAQYILVKKYGPYGVIGGLIMSFLMTATWVIPVCFYRKMKDKVGLTT